MSWEAAAWAVRKGKDYELEPITRYVMLTLANYADKEGNDIYPSIATLELDTGLSESTIRRHIKHLMDVRLLEYGDQSIVANNPRFRKDKLPKVYRFIFDPTTCHSDTPSMGNGVSERRSRGVTRGVTVTPKPLNRKDKPAAAKNSPSEVQPSQGAEPVPNDATRRPVKPYKGITPEQMERNLRGAALARAALKGLPAAEVLPVEAKDGGE